MEYQRGELETGVSEESAFEKAGKAVGIKTEPVRNEAKVGRNDPCPCGSGLKYKKCGLINAAQHAIS